MRFLNSLLKDLFKATFISSVFFTPTAIAETADINVRSIDQFKVGSDQTRFGVFKYIGGIEITSDNNLVGAMSGIRFDKNRLGFTGVMDTGHWFEGDLVRHVSGQPIGIKNFQVEDIIGASGKKTRSKSRFDAESIVVDEERLIVGFERYARIDVYPSEGFVKSPPLTSLPIQIPKHELRSNGGIEALALSPDIGPLSGALIAITERSVNNNGDLFAAILDGPQKGVFFVKRDPPFNVTDADFLPNGDLLVLERRFNLALGVGMRIRLIDGKSIKKGATVDGTVLLDVGAGYQIDNMEGLDIIQDENGDIFIILVSDDNHSFLQRNLLLEFKMVQ